MISVEFFNEKIGKIKKMLKDERKVLTDNGLDLEVVRINASDGMKDGMKNDSIDNIIKRTEDTTFRVLVMGRFSSGKSAFVNVLLGEKLLPERMTPATAIITEIYYGEKKRVVMYPKKGMWKGGNEPFEIEASADEIKRYSTLNNSAGLNTKEANRINSCFEKMVIYWPLDLLKGGVSIIDSPGTNDPYSNDHIVEEYVPKADAILYCIAATQAYDMTDRRTLESINAIGFSNPIIVTTYFDLVKDEKSKSEDEIKDFISETIDKYMHHTTKECCHYVNSKQGMYSKQNSDNVAYVESGYSELEKFLSRYLTNNTGKEKIEAVSHAVELYNANQCERIKGIIGSFSVPEEEFNRRLEQAETALSYARKSGENIKREFTVEMGSVKKNVLDDYLPKLCDKMYEVDLDNFKPSTEFTVWSPKKSSQAMAEECVEELKTRQMTVVGTWQQDILIPYIKQECERIGKNMDSQFQRFSDDIGKTDMSVIVDSPDVQTGTKKVTKVSMLAYALVTGDWLTALIGGAFGVAAFGRTMLCQFTAGFILAIIGIFTPIGLPALVIAGLAALIGGMTWNSHAASGAIKKQVMKEYKKNLKEKREEIIQNVYDKCQKEIFDKVESNLSEAIEADISTAMQNITIIREEYRTQKNESENRIAALRSVLSFLEKTNADIDVIKSEFRI